MLRNINTKILSLIWRRKSQPNLVSFSRQATALTEPGRIIQVIGQWNLRASLQHVAKVYCVPQLLTN